MTTCVVDTNVAIAANRRSTHADLQCQLVCVKVLEDICARGIVAVDDRRLIIEEYARHLNSGGAEGAGDKFFKHVFNRQYDKTCVRRVSIAPVSDDDRGFEELPGNDLDRSDRKFLATALVAGGVILNATDSDWHEQQALLDQLAVTVRQLCPQHSAKVGVRRS